MLQHLLPTPCCLTSLRRRGIGNTSIPAKLPACAARDMPKLKFKGQGQPRAPPPPSPPPFDTTYGVQQLAAGAASLSGGERSSRSRATLTAALLAVALVAVAAAAGGLALRRRRKQQQEHGRWQRLPPSPQPPQPTQPDGLASLMHRARWQASRPAAAGEQPGSEAAWLVAQQPGGAAAPEGRAVPAVELVPGRARLKELIWRELASRPRGLEVLRPGPLPAAMVHQLAAGGCSPSPGASFLTADDGEEQRQQLVQARGGDGGDRAAARQWGLQSETLRLDPEKLQVGVGGVQLDNGRRQSQAGAPARGACSRRRGRAGTSTSLPPSPPAPAPAPAFLLAARP